MFSSLESLLAYPAFWLALTLCVYVFGQYLFRLSNGNPFLSPIIVTVVILMAILAVTGIPYATYFAGANFIHFLLGPATVALAVPLYEQRSRLAKLWIPLTAGLLVGCLVCIVSVILIGLLFGLSTHTLVSMVPKSVTTPIAMGISEKIGGEPNLTAAFVVITGISGSIMGRPLFNLVKIHSDPARGFALGLTAHGMGTSAAFQIGSRAGAFGGLAMGIMGILCAFMAPFVALPLLHLLGR